MKQPTRREFIGTAALLASATAASAALPLTPMQKNYPVVHHVFFWMKNPDSKADRDQLVAGVKTLSKIKAIKALHVGVVADTEKRDVVDHSWGVSELMFFEDLAAQASYQDDPIHLEFIKNCSHLWEKVIVYDIAEA
ncbi:Dabb family protein [Pedobacter sp.]|uniref:Dabb family protein n=1 Tax=Pedobacter sp. TaxID=1411316 RepID=UPI003D7FDA84